MCIVRFNPLKKAQPSTHYLFLFVVIVYFQLTYFLLLQLFTGSILLYPHRCSLEKSLFRCPSKNGTGMGPILHGVKLARQPLTYKRRNPGLSFVLQRRRSIILLSKSFTCQFSILSLLVVHKRAHTDLPHSVSWKRWEEGMGEGVGLGGGSPRLYVIQTRPAGNTYVFSFPHAQYPLVENA